ncbi:MAG: hypothetical protein D3920_01725 [Candidatus Electrothrix sp. AW2]|nr:hypothetical protein [Candidatus Electrothrix sp. AX1]MCI5118855.1 hypothetical protein [Candidatus Electrothrix gigas]MCI5133793.1 hypothetical protein [Candidatus Electrothrix gigas]MCI5177741.1 hypothetical protein [Candidatus Electrothrix gigas]MCI5182684.1 hypothetical protein [Candidatus Electrothrix gigas]
MQKDSQKFTFLFFSLKASVLLSIFKRIPFLKEGKGQFCFKKKFVSKKTQMVFKNLNVVFLTQSQYH